MKKLLLLAGLAVGLQLAATASDPEIEGPSSLNARAATLTRAMANKMHLDEGQFVKLKQLNMRMLASMEDLKIRFAADPDIRDARLAEAQVSYNTELATLLRPTQLLAYKQTQENMTALGFPSGQ